jgi:Type IV secretion-system coupling protein DNA-binding domain
MSEPSHPFLNALAHLSLFYAVVLAGMLLGSAHGKAPTRQYLGAPLVAIPVFFVGSIVREVLSPIVGIDPRSAFNLIFEVPLLAAIGYGAARLLAAFATGSSSPQHLRGAVVAAINQFFASNPKHPASITIAGLPIAPADETKHFKIIGATGTGKSTAIQEILRAALARGDRAIIADPDGGYLSRFYDPARDVILNPFDPDARKWDLFGEITNNYDVEQLARSLIPDRGGEDRIWAGYARTVFSAVVQQAISVNQRSDAELLRLLVNASQKELRAMLLQTSAAPFLEEGNEKLFGSVRSVASSAIEALKYTVQHKAEPLSVRQWVRNGAARANGGQGGVLFIPYRAGEIAALASMISAWMRLGIFQAMDLPEGDQRLWFVVDELDALGAIDGLKDALARLRKFGGRCILGFQSIAQVSGTYGRSVAETIVENCGNTLILRCSASEHGGTSEFASKLIGQREVLHTTYSKSRRRDEWISSVTSNEQLRIEPAVMASEIERLPDLSGYLKLTSIPDWFLVKLTPAATSATSRPRRPVTQPTPPPASNPLLTAPNPIAAKPSTPPRRKSPPATPRPRAKAKRPPAPKPQPPNPTGGDVQSPPSGAESSN